MPTIRHVTPADSGEWVRMRNALWPHHDPSEHAAEAAAFFARRQRGLLAVLLALDDSGTPIGFAELNIRAYSEGCETDRVAFLEGWYVDARARRTGVGTALIRASEEWARTQGCVEFASNALADNDASTMAHLGAGFSEVEVVRYFMKKLDNRGPHA